MRSLEDARQAWQTLEAYDTLNHLKGLIKQDSGRSSVVTGIRSIIWKACTVNDTLHNWSAKAYGNDKAFLLFESLDRSKWQATLSDSRGAYVSLRNHFLRAIEHPDELESSGDPLSDNDESPWVALRRDEALRAEILQDVERCMPENLYFRQPPTQKMLLDILFIFCKLNPDVGYRQGMHEILAPIVWVVERDAIDLSNLHQREHGNRLLITTLDGRYIEHDTFTLFGLIMQNAKSFYETTAQIRTSKATENVTQLTSQRDSPIVSRCRRIVDDLLNSVDPALAAHLKEIDIVPQVFLMRWIRLLFGREFPFDQVLEMWDVIFAEDATFEIVDYICVAMLLRIRWQLMDAGYDAALALLLRYPEQPVRSSPSTLIEDAVYLRDHLTVDAGRHVITKHTGRPPPLISLVEGRPLPSNSTIERQTDQAGSPRGPSARSLQQPSGLEAILQEAARGVYTKGEEWGVNKALRDAVLEVRKNVQSLQSGDIPAAARSRITAPVREPVVEYNQPKPDLLRRIESLESRNKSLAKMLQAAVAQLWDHQKDMNDKNPESEAIKALSVAVAKVQMVQVFLEDSSIPLPTEEVAPKASQEPIAPVALNEKQTEVDEVTSEVSMLISAATPSLGGNMSSTRLKRPSIMPVPTTTAKGLPEPHSPVESSRLPPRPPLAQSSFSWMLGQDPKPSKSFVSPIPFPSEQRRQSQRDSKNSFLFGHENDNSNKNNEARGRSEKKIKNEKPHEDSEEVFNLGTLKRGKRL